MASDCVTHRGLTAAGTVRELHPVPYYDRPEDTGTVHHNSTANLNNIFVNSYICTFKFDKG